MGREAFPRRLRQLEVTRAVLWDTAAEVRINEPLTPRYASIGLEVPGACAIDRDLAARWAGWVQKARQDDPDDLAGSDDALILMLLADGLWMSDIFGVHKITMEQRKALGTLMLAGSRLMETRP